MKQIMEYCIQEKAAGMEMQKTFQAEEIYFLHEKIYLALDHTVDIQGTHLDFV